MKGNVFKKLMALVVASAVFCAPATAAIAKDLTAVNDTAIVSSFGQDDPVNEDIVETDYKGIHASSLYSSNSTITKIDQIEAKKDTVTIGWNDTTATAGSAYYIHVTAYYGASQIYKKDDSANGASSYTLYNLPQGASVSVTVYRDSDYSNNYASYNNAQTLPTKVSPSATGPWYVFGGGDKLALNWGYDNDANYYNDGTCVQLYNKAGKKIATYYSNKAGYSFRPAAAKSTTKPYKVVLRHYFETAGGKKYFGEKRVIYCVPDAKITSKKSDIHFHKINLKWKKVSGASKYTVYAAKSKDYTVNGSSLKFKKVGTTKKTSFAFKKLSGSTISTNKAYYYVYVVPSVKMDKKTRKSNRLHGAYFHMYAY